MKRKNKMISHINIYIILFNYVVVRGEGDIHGLLTGQKPKTRNSDNAWLNQTGSVYGGNKTEPYDDLSKEASINNRKTTRIFLDLPSEVKGEIVLTKTKEMRESTEILETKMRKEITEVSTVQDIKETPVIEAIDVTKEEDDPNVTEVIVATNFRVAEGPELTEASEIKEGTIEDETVLSPQNYKTTVISPTYTLQSNGTETNGSEEVKKSDVFSTYGYVRSLLDGIISSTTTTEHPIVVDVIGKIQNETYRLGYFTGFLIKALEIIPKKTYKEQVELTKALMIAYSQEYEKGLFVDMGKASRIILRKLEGLYELPPDVVRSEAIWAKEMLEYRELYLADDTNEILNKIDKWYIRRQQGKILINTLPLLYDYPKNNLTAKYIADNILLQILVPYYRAPKHDREEAFQPINEALEKRFIYPRRNFQNNVKFKKRYRKRKPRNFGRNENVNNGGRKMHGGHLQHGRFGRINIRKDGIHDRSDRDRSIHDKEHYYGGIRNDKVHKHDVGRHYDRRDGTYERNVDFHDGDRYYHDSSYDRNHNHHRQLYRHDANTNIEARDRNVDHRDHFNDGSYERLYDSVRNINDKFESNRHRVPDIDDRISKVDDSSGNSKTETPYKIKLVVKNKNDDFENHHFGESEYEYSSASQYYETSYEAEIHNHGK